MAPVQESSLLGVMPPVVPAFVVPPGSGTPLIGGAEAPVEEPAMG